MKRIGKTPKGSFLVTADVVGLYPSIPHKEGILALKSKLEEQTSSKTITNDLVELAEFVLKIIFLNLTTKLSNRSVVLLLGLSLLLHTLGFIWIKQTDFLKTQELQPFVRLRYIDDIFFIWTHGEAELKKFSDRINNFLPNLQFTYESSKKKELHF